MVKALVLGFRENKNEQVFPGHSSGARLGARHPGGTPRRQQRKGPGAELIDPVPPADHTHGGGSSVV